MDLVTADELEDMAAIAAREGEWGLAGRLLGMADRGVGVAEFGPDPGPGIAYEEVMAEARLNGADAPALPS